MSIEYKGYALKAEKILSKIENESFEFFSEQDRRPDGLFGRIVISIVFERGNAFLNVFGDELMSV